jgi:hypothetical protein
MPALQCVRFAEPTCRQIFDIDDIESAITFYGAVKDR